MPDPYRRFLLRNNGGRPPRDKDTVDVEGLPGGSTGLQFFYGLNYGLNSLLVCYDLRWNKETLCERIPEDRLAIACDAFGSRFCISLQGADRGAVIFCDLQSVYGHFEVAPDFYPVAPDFDSFLNKLRECTDEPEPPGDLANQPPPPYLSQPAPGSTSHAGPDGLEVAGAGGGGSAAGGSWQPRNGPPVKAADHAGHAEVDATPRKGKTFRGGSKHTRDNWYGDDRDKSFVMWWHRQGKQEFGGNDIDSAAEAKAMYEYWLQIGKPVPK